MAYTVASQPGLDRVIPQVNIFRIVTCFDRFSLSLSDSRPEHPVPAVGAFFAAVLSAEVLFQHDSGLGQVLTDRMRHQRTGGEYSPPHGTHCKITFNVRFLKRP